MVRVLVIALSALVLAGAAVTAGLGRDTRSYSTDDVLRAFTQQDFVLVEPPRYVNDPKGGVIVSPLVGRNVGTFYFPKAGDFYVFVAESDGYAKEFFKPLEQAGGGPRVFDLHQGNVVVSSDASLTERGLTRRQRQRIRAAMASLAGSR